MHSLRRKSSLLGWKQWLTDYEGRILDVELTQRMARLLPVSALTVAIDTQGVHVHASLDSGEIMDMSLVPEKVRFATGGAKEVEVRLEPAQLASHPLARTVVGAFASIVAHRMWRVVLPALEPPELAVVDQDSNIFRIDLRSVPAVRQVLHRQWACMITDLLSLQRLELEPGQLRLVFASFMPER